MASISKNADGVCMLQFMLGTMRKSIWLGKATKRDRDTWKHHVEELVSAKMQGRSPYDETVQWANRLDPKLRKKLVGSPIKDGDQITGYTIGLLEPAAEAESKPAKPAHRPTVGEIFDKFVDARNKSKKGLKPESLKSYHYTRECLIEFPEAGLETPIADFTVGHAKALREWMIRSKENGGKGSSDNTANSRCVKLKGVFQSAADYGLIPSNPFDKLDGLGVKGRKKITVTREMAEQVLNACPDQQWRLLFALSRFAGLRTPSEVQPLCWGHVDLERGWLDVASPKTERHAGRDRRLVPIDSALRKELEAARAELLEDFDPKAKRLSEQFVIWKYRKSSATISSQLKTIVRRAGLTPWKSMFNTLRSSRATELALIPGISRYTVAQWQGSNERTLEKSYFTQTPAEQLVAINWKPLQEPTRTELDRASQEWTDDNSVDVSREKIQTS